MIMSGQQERLQPSNDGSNSTSDTGYVPPPLADFTLCRTPIKKVYDGSDIPNWLESEAFERVMTVMMRCNAAIRGKRRDDGERRRETTNPTVLAIVDMLDHLEGWATEIPLDAGPQRFGNKAFRLWGKRLEERSEELHRAWVPPTHSRILVELLYYFNNAFGNFVRIDYGSGHELSFLGYLTILRYTGLLTEEDEQDLVFVLFERYLRVCRRLQLTYRLEPAGSKGVWGLEDHQFLNFLWGSSQLIGQSDLKPADILSPSTIKPHSDDYLFLSSIEHINTLKRGPFNEHSPILYNIATTVPTWAKVNSGLIKMYQAEVLEKHPVIQHFYFGELLPWRRRGSRPGEGHLESSGDNRRRDVTGDGETSSSAITADAGMPMTKAPWATGATASLHGGPATSTPWASTSAPQASTSAPWASTKSAGDAGGPMATIRAPWATSTMETPASSTSGAGPAHFSGSFSRSRPAQPALRSVYDEPAAPPPGGTRTLASTGSAAALSSPLGAISQPLTGGPAQRQPGRQ